MSKKISDFFTKKLIKVESSEVDPKVISSNINDNISVKLEIEESFPNLGKNSTENLQTSESGQSKINENVKTEAEKELLLILPQEKIYNYPVPIKTEDNKPKIDKFQCQICKKTISSLGRLKRHQKVHEVEHKCKYCSKIFRLNCLMLTHIKSVHEKATNFKCDVCKVGYCTKAYLTRHQRIHTKNRPKPFKCDKCDHATDDKSSLKKHLKSHERIIERCDKCNKKLFKSRIHDCRLDCKFCGKKFSLTANVATHIKKHHAHETDKSFYECDICGLKCYRKKMMMYHMEAKHIDEKVQIFTCDLDGKTFKLKAKLNHHMKHHQTPVNCDFCFVKLNVMSVKGHILKFHTGIKPPKKQPRKKPNPKTTNFQCPMCFKILSTKLYLKIHISDHNKTLKCSFCEKMFGSQSSLKAHIRIYHENTESYICEICERKFTFRSSLKKHMKFHDPNHRKDLKCSQCDYATDNKGNFEKHLKSHERRNAEIAAIKNPHKCPQCSTIKGSQKLLKKHMSRVHPKVLLECDICGKQMKTRSHILRHLRRYHKIGS